MLSSSADYKTAIAATDREIRGYLQFSNGFILSGSGGLISFKSTQTAMDAERFCVGSVTSAFCEASFFNSGLDGSGVSLANSYFDAYCGVVTGNPPDAETDYTVETLMATRNITTSTGATQIPDINLRSKLVALSDGAEVIFNIGGTDYVGIWDDALHSVTVTDGTLNYTVSYISFDIITLYHPLL